MNKPLFRLEIIGDAVLPQTVKAADLGALLSNLEAAVASTLQGETPLAMESKEAIIDDKSPIPAPSYPKAIGTTTLSGELLRVGGATPRAEVRLRDGRIVYIDINESQAKQLASRLYEEVSIEGRATWNSNDWTIQDFKATRITDYRPGSLIRAFEELASLSGDIWSDVDPVEYVNDLRKED